MSLARVAKSCMNPEPLVAEVIITDRDAKPRKGSLHRQCFQRLAAYRRELLLTLFDVFEDSSVQRYDAQKNEEHVIISKMIPDISGRTIAGSYDAKAGSNGFSLAAVRAVRDVAIERLKQLPESELREEAILIMGALGSPFAMYTPRLDEPQSDESDEPQEEDEEDLSREVHLSKETFDNPRPVICMATGGQKTTTTPAWIAETL